MLASSASSWRVTSLRSAARSRTTGGAVRRGGTFATGTPNESELERYMTETLVPMMRPCASRMGPPLIPEFRGMDSSMRSTAPLAANPLKMPSIKLSPRPRGLPRATMGEPGAGRSGAMESGAARRFGTDSTARSFSTSKARTVAGKLSAAVRTRTSNRSGSARNDSTTW